MHYNSLIRTSILILISLSTYANEPAYTKPILTQEDTLNLLDNSGKKHGYWVVYGKDVDSTLNYPVDGKVREGRFKHGRKEGIWIFYYKDGKTPKLKGSYSNNRPEGTFTKFWPNGAIKEEGEFANQKFKNQLKRYNDKGILIYEASFNDNGDENGKVKYFYDDGTLQFEYNAENGRPKGEAKRFYPNGDLKEKITYDEYGALLSSEKIERVNPEKNEAKKPSGRKAPVIEDKSTLKLNGYNKVYNSNKELWQDGKFKDGKLWDGQVYIYDEDGLLLKIEVFKEGVYHSDGQL